MKLIILLAVGVILAFFALCPNYDSPKCTYTCTFWVRCLLWAAALHSFCEAWRLE